MALKHTKKISYEYDPVLFSHDTISDHISRFIASNILFLPLKYMDISLQEFTIRIHDPFLKPAHQPWLGVACRQPNDLGHHNKI